MLVKATPEKVIAVAKSYIGYLEKASASQLDDFTANAGNKNYTKFARDLDTIPGFYNTKKQGIAWCDVGNDAWFVYAFGAAAAKTLLCQPDKSCGAGCYYSMQYYKKKGQFHKTGPKPGDQIFFGTSTNVKHTGLVVDVDSTYVYTVEGNTSSASGVVANGGGVYAKRYLLTHSAILGYGRPDYDSVWYDDPEADEPASQPESAEKVAGGTELAEHFDTAKAGVYKVKQCSGLMFRAGPGTDRTTLATLPTGTVVTCLGHYTGDWLRVETADSRVGFCHSDYLVKG